LREEYAIDVLDKYGRTPLMHAVHNDHLDTVDALAKLGAATNAQEPIAGSTALHDAAYQGSALMV
jgi:ankyrin repeat protein